MWFVHVDDVLLQSASRVQPSRSTPTSASAAQNVYLKAGEIMEMGEKETRRSIFLYQKERKRNLQQRLDEGHAGEDVRFCWVVASTYRHPIHTATINDNILRGHKKTNWMQENRKFFFINGGSYGFTSVTEIKKEIPVVSSSFLHKTNNPEIPSRYIHTHTHTNRNSDFKGIADVSREYKKKTGRIKQQRTSHLK